MDAIRIETTLSAETFQLPELAPLMGKSVEIVVREKSKPRIIPPKTSREEALEALNAIEDYDFDAWRRIRDAELTS